MTRRRLAAAGAGILLWAGTVVASVAFGTTGLLLVLAAFVVGLLILAVALLARTGRLTRAIAAISRDVGAISRDVAAASRDIAVISRDVTATGRSIAELVERQDRSTEASDALQPAIDNLYTQVDALLGLHSTLKPQRPLPPLRIWAVSPDFMARAVSIVLDRRPATIVECGSGTSTVYLGLALRQVGRGRIVALEHKERFAEATRHLVAEHGLDDVATVRHAPLRPVTIDGREWLWYDPVALEEVVSCELLVVDGPPRTVQKLARYPALPLLRDRLVPGAIVLMDDYRRDSERRTVRRWRNEYPDLTLRVHEHEKQTAEIELPGG